MLSYLLPSFATLFISFDFQKGDASSLHIIIFDEIDAICKQRGSAPGTSGVNDSIVNQLLSKIDGVDALNNILVSANEQQSTNS